MCVDGLMPDDSRPEQLPPAVKARLAPDGTPATVAEAVPFETPEALTTVTWKLTV